MDSKQTTSTVESVTRRTLLKTGGAFAVTMTLPEAGMARRRKRGRHHHAHKRLNHLRRSSYHPLVGEHFTLAGTRAEMRLVDVRDLTWHQRGSEDAFILVFRAPRGAPSLAGRLPQFSHPSLGDFPLMVVPGELSSAGQHYVAVINRTHA